MMLANSQQDDEMDEFMDVLPRGAVAAKKAVPAPPAAEASPAKSPAKAAEPAPAPPSDPAPAPPVEHKNLAATLKQACDEEAPAPAEEEMPNESSIPDDHWSSDKIRRDSRMKGGLTVYGPTTAAALGHLSLELTRKGLPRQNRLVMTNSVLVMMVVSHTTPRAARTISDAAATVFGDDPNLLKALYDLEREVNRLHAVSNEHWKGVRPAARQKNAESVPTDDLAKMKGGEAVILEFRKILRVLLTMTNLVAHAADVSKRNYQGFELTQLMMNYREETISQVDEGDLVLTEDDRAFRQQLFENTSCETGEGEEEAAVCTNVSWVLMMWRAALKQGKFSVLTRLATVLFGLSACNDADMTAKTRNMTPTSAEMRIHVKSGIRDSSLTNPIITTIRYTPIGVAMTLALQQIKERAPDSAVWGAAEAAVSSLTWPRFVSLMYMTVALPNEEGGTPVQGVLEEVPDFSEAVTAAEAVLARVLPKNAFVFTGTELAAMNTYFRRTGINPMVYTFMPDQRVPSKRVKFGSDLGITFGKQDIDAAFPPGQDNMGPCIDLFRSENQRIPTRDEPHPSMLLSIPPLDLRTIMFTVHKSVRETHNNISQVEGVARPSKKTRARTPRRKAEDEYSSDEDEAPARPTKRQRAAAPAEFASDGSLDSALRALPAIYDLMERLETQITRGVQILEALEEKMAPADE